VIAKQQMQVIIPDLILKGDIRYDTLNMRKTVIP